MFSQREIKRVLYTIGRSRRDRGKNGKERSIEGEEERKRKKNDFDLDFKRKINCFIQIKRDVLSNAGIL